MFRQHMTKTYPVFSYKTFAIVPQQRYKEHTSLRAFAAALFIFPLAKIDVITQYAMERMIYMGKEYVN